MIENRADVFAEFEERVTDYHLMDDDELEGAIHEIADSMVDIYTSDLLESIEFLYNNCDFTEVSGNLLQAIQGAQYDYYYGIAMDDFEELKVTVFGEKEDDNE